MPRRRHLSRPFDELEENGQADENRFGENDQPYQAPNVHGLGPPCVQPQQQNAYESHRGPERGKEAEQPCYGASGSQQLARALPALCQ
jgi:hypothetical protein